MDRERRGNTGGQAALFARILPKRIEYEWSCVPNHCQLVRLANHDTEIAIGLQSPWSSATNAQPAEHAAIDDIRRQTKLQN
jgi:hypothetical protein